MQETRIKQSDGAYYQNVRSEILPALSRRYQRALDVGGGEGRTSQMLVTCGHIETADLWDYESKVVEAARLTGLFRDARVVDLEAPETLPEVGQFDLIMLLDVLEHLRNPWVVLRHLRHYLAPGGHMIVSLPNVRDLSVLLPLIVRGDWEYAENGVLDATHLRFFTRKSMRRMIREAGLMIECEIPVRSGPRAKLDRMSGRLMTDLLSKQYVFRCAPGPSA